MTNYLFEKVSQIIKEKYMFGGYPLEKDFQFKQFFQCKW